MPQNIYVKSASVPFPLNGIKIPQIFQNFIIAYSASKSSRSNE
jgi:hypothetical protein